MAKKWNDTPPLNSLPICSYLCIKGNPYDAYFSSLLISVWKCYNLTTIAFITVYWTQLVVTGTSRAQNKIVLTFSYQPTNYQPLTLTCSKVFESVSTIHSSLSSSVVFQFVIIIIICLFVWKNNCVFFLFFVIIISRKPVCDSSPPSNGRHSLRTNSWPQKN